uniref:Uncharacterized protein n=1 Tax=Rhizophora mucronata TaxID=61149 RepID=A0A2P2Q013_RHIMU
MDWTSEWLLLKKQ